MKTTMLLLALLGLAAPRAHAGPPQTYKSVVRVTLPVVATSSAIYAFQNTSAGEDVVIRKIELTNCSTFTVAGGLAAYWLYTSTSLTHSAAVTSSYALGDSLVAQLSGITVSTAPRNIQVEGDASILTTGGALSGVPPLFRPLFVNNDETATANLTDFWSETADVRATSGVDNPVPLVLPAGDNRAVVIQQKRLGTADVAGGSLCVSLIYTRR